MGKSELSRRKLFLKAFIILCMLLNAVTPQTSDEGLTSCEIDALVRQLANPSQEYEMHAAALRSQLRSLLGKQQIDDYQTIDSDIDSSDFDKRSVGSLARNGFLQNGKRYLGSLARSDSLRSQLDTIKRSIATLAKNGQLPSREPDYNDSTQMNEKRNLGSVARSGSMTGKRNVGSLARDFQLPSYGKRNLASLARYGLMPSISPKRNMASLARMGAFPTYKRDIGDAYWSDDSNSGEILKRNLGALKNSPTHGQREKRDLGDNMEIADPILQNPPLDYEELKDMLSHVYNLYYGGNTHEEKRFLGSVARSGWYQYRPTSDKRNLQSLARNGLLRYDNSDYGGWSTNDRDTYKQQEEKRHIGSVARSGWLPAFRPIRSGRFSRSGRARSNTTPNKSDFDNPSRPFVDDVTKPELKIPLVGAHLDYRPPGVLHPDLQHYIGEVYAEPNHFIKQPNPTVVDSDVFNDDNFVINDNNNYQDYSENYSPEINEEANYFQCCDSDEL